MSRVYELQGLELLDYDSATVPIAVRIGLNHGEPRAGWDLMYHGTGHRNLGSIIERGRHGLAISRRGEHGPGI